MNLERSFKWREEQEVTSLLPLKKKKKTEKETMLYDKVGSKRATQIGD